MAFTAIIGGTGVYDPGILDNTSEHIQNTSYGPVKILMGDYQGQQVALYLGTAWITKCLRIW